MKLQLLHEMPWIADLTCPKCGLMFDVDCRVETWPFKMPDLKKIIHDYTKYNLYCFDCPSCNVTLLHNSKKHVTNEYNSQNFNKLPPMVRKFLQNTKPILTKTVKDQYDKNFNMAQVYGLKEKMTFKEFCNVYNSLH